jgi:nicotinate-nucleotide pyrophosphorylase (carboxylating)
MNEAVKKIIAMALAEDIPNQDISSEYLFTDETAFGRFIAKEAGVISGMLVCKEVFFQIDPTLEFNIIRNDSEVVQKGEIIATVKGLTKSILAAERVGLNFLQRMSGIATMTKAFVDQCQGSQTKILDTRKTTPLLRALEKQAVIHGGGMNHRMNLSDMVMLKDNHLHAAKSIIAAVDKVRENLGKAYKIEVEVENLEQFHEALQSDCDIIMLDNMSNEDMSKCVQLNQGKKMLEASGNMTLERIRSVAQTGVDFISVGGLTHSYKSMDISLKF